MYCIAAIQDAAHPIVTEGGDGGVQANGTCDDAEHEVTGTEGVQVIEEETKVTEGVHNEGTYIHTYIRS